MQQATSGQYAVDADLQRRSLDFDGMCSFQAAFCYTSCRLHRRRNPQIRVSLSLATSVQH